MGFDRKMDSKPVWEASPPLFSFTVHFTVHPTTDSTYHTVRPLGRRQSTDNPARQEQGRPRKVGSVSLPSTFARLDHSLAIVADENHGTPRRS